MNSKHGYNLAERPKVNFRKTLEMEGLLIQHILLYQRTLRVAGIVPTYSNFIQTEVYHDMLKDLDTTDLAKYRAWWEMIFDCQRQQDDNASVTLCVAFIVQETQRRSQSKVMTINTATLGIAADHIAKIKDTVLRHFEKLHPSRAGVKLADANHPLLA